MWPIKLYPNAGSVIIEDDLCASFTYNHAVSSKLAISLVKVNMSNVRNLPAIGRRQMSVEIQEFIDTHFGVGKIVKVNVNAVLIADHSVYKCCSPAEVSPSQRAIPPLLPFPSYRRVI